LLNTISAFFMCIYCSGEGNRRVGGLAMFWKEGVEAEGSFL